MTERVRESTLTDLVRMAPIPIAHTASIGGDSHAGPLSRRSPRACRSPAFRDPGGRDIRWPRAHGSTACAPLHVVSRCGCNLLVRRRRVGCRAARHRLRAAAHDGHPRRRLPRREPRVCGTRGARRRAGAAPGGRRIAAAGPGGRAPGAGGGAHHGGDLQGRGEEGVGAGWRSLQGPPEPCRPAAQRTAAGRAQTRPHRRRLPRKARALAALSRHDPPTPSLPHPVPPTRRRRPSTRRTSTPSRASTRSRRRCQAFPAMRASCVWWRSVRRCGATRSRLPTGQHPVAPAQPLACPPSPRRSPWRARQRPRPHPLPRPGLPRAPPARAARAPPSAEGWAARRAAPLFHALPPSPWARLLPPSGTRARCPT